ncbi:small subunit ribosomal protein S3e, cytoplasmic [Guillardia theta CCMP2712]|uniref:40S ribosomal protein S3 n=2 Tax=Guillardia theta TaxID=55529 RepID=L1JIC8_GUITC|nr:small subunit ribosomal protein S3e, cytoplasmic [Guillardia theta CCMP2712]EKX48082.1 small subunit ribosomal protein S3e, cytoplasmic [Guillardia theta CCMP2712]|eukprot:XP_005835062.1 small subunit ribosomal protein S3e, cytoplasmic [Guillardia theta CCMP2712]
MPQNPISKKRKFVQDGVLYAELNEMLMHELAEDGYSGVEIRRTPMRTEIIIRATRTREVLGEKGQRIRELTSAVQKRFGFAEGTVEMFAERVHNRGLSAMAQAESLKFKLLGGLQVRRACYGVIRFVMESGALGVEVIVSGKARVQRAKSMKFKSGFLITTGRPAQVFIDKATRHVMMKQGVLGIRLKIMLPHDPEGKNGPKTPFPDTVTILDPKEDKPPVVPTKGDEKAFAAPTMGAPRAMGAAPMYP